MSKQFRKALLLLLLPFYVNAEYTDSCGIYAQMLWSSADSYDFAKSSFKSTCDSYNGYSNDEHACGSSGYKRTSYDRAKSELEDALNNVALFCGPCDGILGSYIRESNDRSKKYESEISDLKKRLVELEAESKARNKKIKLTQ